MQQRDNEAQSADAWRKRYSDARSELEACWQKLGLSTSSPTVPASQKSVLSQLVLENNKSSAPLAQSTSFLPAPATLPRQRSSQAPPDTAVHSSYQTQLLHSQGLQSPPGTPKALDARPPWWETHLAKAAEVSPKAPSGVAAVRSSSAPGPLHPGTSTSQTSPSGKSMSNPDGNFISEVKAVQ